MMSGRPTPRTDTGHRQGPDADPTERIRNDLDRDLDRGYDPETLGDRDGSGVEVVLFNASGSERWGAADADGVNDIVTDDLELGAFGKAHPKGAVSLSRTLRSREAQRADRQYEEAGRRESSASKRPTELSRGLLAAFGKAHPKGTVSLSRTLRSREAQRADRQSEEAGRRESSVSKRPTELSRGLLERRSGTRTEHPEAQRIPGAVRRKASEGWAKARVQRGTVRLDESSDRQRTKAGIRWVQEATGEFLIGALDALDDLVVQRIDFRSGRLDTTDMSTLTTETVTPGTSPTTRSTSTMPATDSGSSLIAGCDCGHVPFLPALRLVGLGWRVPRPRRSVEPT